MLYPLLLFELTRSRVTEELRDEQDYSPEV